MSFSAQAVLEALNSVVAGRASLHEPEINGNEWAYVKDCLETGWVSSVGSYVERFGDMLTEVTGVAHAVATVNGTAALHTCLLLSGVGPDDEVIIPALSFVATANAVSYCHAVPHFADSDEATLGLDPGKLDDHLARISKTERGQLVNVFTGRRIAAVVCMHTFGHPVDLDEVTAVCRKYGLPLIEDAAESLGSCYKGRHTGSHGLVSALSFNGNKIVTTGGGGAVMTNDAKLAAKAKHLTTTAKVQHAWEFDHDQVGYNYRLTNVNAAIGCAQLERLDAFVERKRRLAARYAAAFDGVPGVRYFTEPAGCRSNYWLNVVLLDSSIDDQRDVVLKLVNEAGLMSRPAWRPLAKLTPYRDCPRMDLSIAESLYRRLINIPSSPCLVEI